MPEKILQVYNEVKPDLINSCQRLKLFCHKECNFNEDKIYCYTCPINHMVNSIMRFFP